MLLSLRLLRRIARELPRYGKLTYCLYRDPRVPQRNKLALAAAMALILNPVVDVPLRLPIFGEMDAVALTVLAVRLFVEKAPKEVVAGKALAARLETAQVVLKLRSGKDGKLFGAVTNADVAAALKQQHGITLDRRKIEFEAPVKAMGPGTAHVKLHREVTARIPLMVASA